ncbi:MAG TPA: Gfo/Idh/MocA family oxidoreductase [Pirellulaceae bacterium]|nr:Gfo/Idh/MocA family oxidoreductase [Pirellulaceae bacterium]
MPDNYRVAVVGHTGRGNYGHGVDTVWLQLPQCKIVGVADANEQGLAAAVKRLAAPKGFADYRQMLDEAQPNIVAIGPRWLDQHRDMVLAAAERGMHIYMEKPMCRTLEEADEMAAACEKHGIKLAVAHQTRYSPKLHVVRDMIFDGRIGKVLELRGRGKEDRRGGGEDLWVLGSHVMNLMHHFGGEPNWCLANVMQDGERVTKLHVAEGAEGIGPLAGDSLTAMYGMDDGVTAYFASTRNMGVGSRFGLQIFGSEGIIEILSGYLPAANYLPDPNWSPGRSGVKWTPISSAGAGQPEPLPDGGLNAGNVLACQDLLAAIEEDRLPECSIYEGRTTVEMIAAVFESHRLGGLAEMPLTNRKNPLTML